jgi:hypothetical protein
MSAGNDTTTPPPCLILDDEDLSSLSIKETGDFRRWLSTSSTVNPFVNGFVKNSSYPTIFYNNNINQRKYSDEFPSLLMRNEKKVEPTNTQSTTQTSTMTEISLLDRVKNILERPELRQRRVYSPQTPPYGPE